eukprot:6633204-Pyramimonas_sp.AAC.1
MDPRASWTVAGRGRAKSLEHILPAVHYCLLTDLLQGTAESGLSAMPGERGTGRGGEATFR